MTKPLVLLPVQLLAPEKQAPRTGSYCGQLDNNGGNYL